MNNMSLFPRNFQQEFSPLYRLMDDYVNLTRDFPSHIPKSLKSFQPKFDVSETKEGYTLHGELPGMEQKDVNIEWTDGNTLTVSGRSEHRHEISSESEKSTTTSEHQASVEDEANKESSENPSDKVATTNQSKAVQKAEDGPKYWVSERSVGEFSRSFSFPIRIDQDNVKASLKNGILEVVVPKSAKPAARKITIE